MKLALLILLGLSGAATAHVGTFDVAFAGDAGPYAVRVSIRQPGVIPGLAQITIRTPAEGVERVLVTALRRIGDAGEAPPPDEARLVPGEAGLFSAQLWLMVRGPHSVIVTVEGDAGEGRVTIPLLARATARLGMPVSLGLVLAGGGLFLTLGLLSIVGAASRESALAPGLPPEARDIRRARVAMVIAGLAVTVLLFGGWRWIRAEADSYRARLDRTWRVETVLDSGPSDRLLRLAITDPRWINRPRDRPTNLLPDHGRMMHLFVVAADDAGAFAHLHPIRIAEDSFAVAFPALPAGRYRLFADIVIEDGAAVTLVSLIEAPAIEPVHVTNSSTAGEPVPENDRDQQAPDGRPPMDRDDAWWVGSGEGGAVAVLEDGRLLRWRNRDVTLVAGEDAELEFDVETDDGSLLAVEPYLGMAGHAMLARRDGEVFIHLHPAGMISIAAQAALERGGAIEQEYEEVAHEMESGETTRPAFDGKLRFPLVVPSAGPYRIWVQVKLDGRIRTVAFDAEVSEERVAADR
jgi:hypothetical protein